MPITNDRFKNEIEDTEICCYETVYSHSYKKANEMC